MNAALPSFQGRLDEVRARIAAAERRSGRPTGSVTLVAVVKTVPADRVAMAIAAGVTDFGENRVQEAGQKIAAVGAAGVRWHMVGHLQRNKAGRGVTLFDRIHSLDSLELALALSRAAVAAGKVVPTLVQINVSAEATKHGTAPQELETLLAAAGSLPGLRIDGLMSIGAPVERPEEARPFFARTRELRDAATGASGMALPELSMGMSGDFETAIEEGSTMVRLGTVLFGPRDWQ